MSDLQNPLFDEEKEFLERKKLEYERALRGDVDHIKDQSVKVGKVALVGAGLAGGIWLITKAFSGKKKPKRPAKKKPGKPDAGRGNAPEPDHDYEFGTGYFSSGRPYDSAASYKSAADSAQVFNEHHEHTHEADDLGFGSTAAAPAPEHPEAYIKTYAPEPADHHEPSGYDPQEFEDDPFQDLPYDDSRRLPASHAFDEGSTPAARAASSRSRMVGTVLQAFLQSDTGKMLVAQAAAVALALVTKKVSEFFPAAKNSDLAASPAPAPAESGFSPAASSVSSAPSDASNPPQSL